MLDNFLQEIGLNKREVAIYLALLPLGKASASVLARRTNLERTTTRSVCNALVDKGLLRLKKLGNVFIFYPEPPGRVASIFEEQKKRLSETESKMNRALAELKAMIDPEFLLPKVRYFEGKKGIIEIYEDILKTGKDVYCWTDLEKKTEIIGKDFIQGYIPRRLGHNIKIHAIKPKTKNAIKDLKNERNRAIKLIDDFSLDGEIRIYGDKVAVITFDKNVPRGFLFEGKVSAAFKAIFDKFWQLASKQQ